MVAADTILKDKKMLHLLILNQTQLTNEVLFSYSSGITKVMSFIIFIILKLFFCARDTTFGIYEWES